MLTLIWTVLDFPTLMLVSHMVNRLLRPSMHQAMLRISDVLLVLVELGRVGMALKSLVQG